MEVFAGLDWGAGSQAVCVIDAKGAVPGRFETGHDRAGLAVLVVRPKRHGSSKKSLPVAMETSCGLLVEAGFAVTPIHPNAVKACRPRYRAVPAKSDPGDTYILADVLRTDGHRLRPLQSQWDAIKALRALVRGRDDLIAARVALANHLTALLDSFRPGAARIFAEVDSVISLAFLDRYPSADAAASLGPKRMASFLTQHHYSGRRSPGILLQNLRAAPSGGHADSAERGAKSKLVRALVLALASVVHQLGQLTRRIEQVVADLPDGRLIMSFPRTGKICAAQILAELGDVRFQTNDQLAAEAGVVPVICQSGKTRGVGWRWACNKRLRKAITCFADDSLHASSWAASIHAGARQRGKVHPHAIRILARARVRVPWRAWIDHKLDDPDRHPPARSCRGAELIPG